MRLHERRGATVVLMAAANSIAAAFAIQDPIKPEASSVIAALKSLGIMVSAAVCQSCQLSLCRQEKLSLRSKQSS